MARGHADLPLRAADVVIRKQDIYAALRRIDGDENARARVLSMETAFRRKIDTHLRALPTADAQLQKFNTSPFVLMFYSRQKGYRRVSEIEKDIIPAKVFSSMETSAGRMVEEVVLPIYGWEVVPSQMHSVESVLDGRAPLQGQRFKCVTLKSGPRCLNDEMAKDIGVDVATHSTAWAATHNANAIEFSYGVLYGTTKQSNKKDWHILRNIAAVLPADAVIRTSHQRNWSIGYTTNGVEITATVRVGLEWWRYLGGEDTWLELCIALIRACIDPALGIRETPPEYFISDLAALLDTTGKPPGFNVAILQESQLEWVHFLARHFCDALV